MRPAGLVLHLAYFQQSFLLDSGLYLRVAALNTCLQQYPQKPHGVTKTVLTQLAGNLQSETRVEVPFREGRQHL